MVADSYEELSRQRAQAGRGRPRPGRPERPMGWITALGSYVVCAQCVDSAQAAEGRIRQGPMKPMLEPRRALAVECAVCDRPLWDVFDPGAP